ncbi:MAG: class IV adenylate cyclase [bacterium]|nr:class IV adenylate cyclase [bacterium]
MTMLNIEIKSVLRDRTAMERRLEEVGAEHTVVLRQRDTFYAVPTGWLKLREIAGEPAELISYERPTDSAQARASAYSRQVLEDVEGWKALLGRVLPVDVVVQKERTLWMLDHTRIHLDRVEDLGDYIELETAVGEIGEEDARAECDRVIELLALDRGEFLSLPYRDLLG